MTSTKSADTRDVRIKLSKEVEAFVGVNKTGVSMVDTEYTRLIGLLGGDRAEAVEKYKAAAAILGEDRDQVASGSGRKRRRVESDDDDEESE